MGCLAPFCREEVLVSNPPKRVATMEGINQTQLYTKSLVVPL